MYDIFVIYLIIFKISSQGKGQNDTSSTNFNHYMNMVADIV